MICLHMIEGVWLEDGRFAYRCEACGVVFGVSPAPGRLAFRRALVQLYWAVDLPAQLSARTRGVPALSGGLRASRRQSDRG